MKRMPLAAGGIDATEMPKVAYWQARRDEQAEWLDKEINIDDIRIRKFVSSDG